MMCIVSVTILFEVKWCKYEHMRVHYQRPQSREDMVRKSRASLRLYIGFNPFYPLIVIAFGVTQFTCTRSYRRYNRNECLYVYERLARRIIVLSRSRWSDVFSPAGFHQPAVDGPKIQPNKNHRCSNKNCSSEKLS